MLNVKKPAILVSGNTTFDIITVCDTPYNMSGKRPVAEYKQLPGGQAANVADLLSNLGNAVSFVGAIGSDFAGKAVQEDFVRAGIDILRSAFCDAPHHLGFVRVDKESGERFIDMYKAPNLNCENAVLSKEWVSGFDAIYIDNHEAELAFRLSRLGHELNIPVVADLEEITAQTNVVLPYVDVLIAPLKIIQKLSEEPKADHAIEKVYNMGFSSVIATMGSDGSLGICDGRLLKTDGITISVKDTTGAGDAFHGAFAHAMLRGHDMESCMAYANEVAAKKCEFLGPRIPTQEVKTIPPLPSRTYDATRWLRHAKL